MSGRFEKGRSGNPAGRPKARRPHVSAFDIVFDKTLTVSQHGVERELTVDEALQLREEGRERRVTAAEAFILQLTKKGLEGDSASARSSLAAIENARAARTARGGDIPLIRIRFRTFGLCCAVEDLGMGVLVHPTDKARVRLMLEPWVVEAALARLGSSRLSVEEQHTVLKSTKTPEKVRWPEWWSVRA